VARPAVDQVSFRVLYVDLGEPLPARLTAQATSGHRAQHDGNAAGRTSAPGGKARTRALPDSSNRGPKKCEMCAPGKSSSAEPIDGAAALCVAAWRGSEPSDAHEPDH
jgi:hypothetical protein